MKHTRQELIEKIKKNDVSFFQNLYMEYGWVNPSRQPEGINKIKRLWDLKGDGNDWMVAFEFIDEKLSVYLEGYYSSEGESEFDTVDFGVPFEFKETTHTHTHRAATLDEIRDMRIEEILN